MSDYRMEAASKEEWMERALRAEAERDQWKTAAEQAYAGLKQMRASYGHAPSEIVRKPNPWRDV